MCITYSLLQLCVGILKVAGSLASLSVADGFSFNIIPCYMLHTMRDITIEASNSLSEFGISLVDLSIIGNVRWS